MELPSPESADQCDSRKPPKHGRAWPLMCDVNRFGVALDLLMQASDYAQDSQRDIWDFAVEIRFLTRAGLNPSDFRWLIYKGYVEHAREVEDPGAPRRTFRRGAHLKFGRHSCFVLTPAGLEFARLLRSSIGLIPANSSAGLAIPAGTGPTPASRHDTGIVAPAGTEAIDSRGTPAVATATMLYPANPLEGAQPCLTPSTASEDRVGNGRDREVPGRRPLGAIVPRWDCDYREIRYENRVVKQFKLPSPNQEAILLAFEEEGWPPRIDDPLPQHPEFDPKQRLHDTIRSLNRNQKNRLLRFKGDGTGQGVLWEPVMEGSHDDSTLDISTVEVSAGEDAD